MTQLRPGDDDASGLMRAVSQLIPISDIGELKAEEYVGLIDRAAIECLKVRLEADGLLTPIWVRKNGNAKKGARFGCDCQ